MISFLENFYSKSIYKYKIHPIDDLKENKICCICLMPLINTKYIILEECKHEYHVDCLNDWIKRSTSCPTCRSNQFNAAVLLYNIKKKEEDKKFWNRISTSSFSCLKK